MKRILSLIILSSLTTGTLFSQTGKTSGIKEKAPHMRSSHTSQSSVGINLSLWKNISTQRMDTVGSTYFSLGLFSSMNKLNGLGINVLGATVRKDMNGLQLGGITNTVGGSMRGLQFAGITNINGNNLSGLSVAGLLSITGNRAQGVVFSGLATIMGDNSSGVTMGGLLNITGERTLGVQLAGLANISGGDIKGCTTSGLLNVAGKDMKGVQVSGLGNITAEDMKGVQISGLGNVTGGTVTGVQLAPINITIHAKGLQIGLVNYYKKSLSGFQLGLVNANPDTKVQLMLFGGNTTKVNVGVRFKNKLFYTILGTGTQYLSFNDKFSGALFYRAGLELPICKRLFISGDLGYQHIETFKNKNYGFPARLYSLQPRVNVEYRLTDCLGVFISGGYSWDRYYNKNATYDHKVLVEGGVILLKY